MKSDNADSQADNLADSQADSSADLLKEAREAFEQARDAENHNRLTFVDDMRFAKLGEQWPEAIKRQRELDKRPCLTINKLPSFIRQVVNDARLNKPSIKVRPADSHGDPEVAEIINGLVRNIEYVSNADVAYDTAIEAAVTGGFGYMRVGLDYTFDDAFEMDVTIERVLNPLSVYGDPASTAADSSDWNVAFITERITQDEFKRRYGDKATTDFEADDWGCISADWMSEEGVLIAEYWTREEVEKDILRLSDGRVLSADELADNPDLALAIQMGSVRITGQRTIRRHKVRQVIMSGIDVLEDNDWPGSFIPIVPVYGDEFTVEGKRYFRSLIHPAKDAQRMHNYWRTTGTELVALAPRVPFIGPEGAFSVDDGWNRVNTDNLPYLEYEGAIPPQRQPMDMGVAAGALQEALNASDDMKAIVGLFNASLGARSNEVSGRAILARQREGDVSTFHFIDNLSRAIRHLGRIVIDLIPHVYNEPRMVRVLGADKKEKLVPINQQVPRMGPDGKPMVDERGEAMMRVFDLSLGKYDLTVESGPSFSTQRQETALALQELIRANGQAAPILGAELVRQMDFPGADKIADRLEKIDPTNPDRLPLEIRRQIQAGKQLIGQLQAENAKLKADRSIDQGKLQIDKFEADTERMEAMAKVRGAL